MPVSAARRPGFAHEPIVHAREIAVALAEFTAQQRHPFNDARIGQSTRIDEAEWHRLDHVHECLLRRLVVAHDKDIAHEPIEPDSPLLRRPNVVLTPHIGGATRDTWSHRMAVAWGNVARVESGLPPIAQIP